MRLVVLLWVLLIPLVDCHMENITELIEEISPPYVNVVETMNDDSTFLDLDDSPSLLLMPSCFLVVIAVIFSSKIAVMIT